MISVSRLLRASGLPLDALLVAGMATSARADPCEGRLPSQPNQQFSSTVRYVGDGDSLCVGTSHDPATWIEVRLADFDAPELIASNGRFLKSLLQQVGSSQTVNYEARRGRSGRVIVFDRVIAVCRVRGRSIGDLLRARTRRKAETDACR